MKSSLAIPVAIIVGGCIIALAVYFSLQNEKAISPSETGNPALVRPVDPSDHILGNPAAQVFIVEYTDFECSYCKDFSRILHQLIATEGARGEVAVVLRHFPLSEIHPNALSHARAAECANQAGGTDAFWKFTDQLFANQPVDPTKYGAHAQAAGVPIDAFAACYLNAEKTFDARIMADRENALAVGARGTPYSLIIRSGKAPIVVDGAYSYDALRALVDQALKN